MWFMNDYEPKMPFKFKAKVNVGRIEADWWDVKSVEKPSFAVTSDKYMLLNREIKFPTNIKWKPISITFVDNVNNKLLKQLINHYNDGENSLFARDDNYKYQSTLSKQETFSNQLEIRQLDSDGNAAEIWIINNFHILDFKFSNADYASDGLSEVAFSIDYEWAYLDDSSNVELSILNALDTAVNSIRNLDINTEGNLSFDNSFFKPYNPEQGLTRKVYVEKYKDISSMNKSSINKSSIDKSLFQTYKPPDSVVKRRVPVEKPADITIPNPLVNNTKK